MTLLSRHELQRLTAQHESPCVSLYLPTVRKDDTAQNAIRFKNMLKQAEKSLISSGLRNGALGRFTARADSLLRDPLFWDHLDQGLAAFLSPDFFEVYSLPYAVPEKAIVNTRFHVKPLFPLISNDGTFFVLAVSRSRARLFEGTRHAVREVPVDGLPDGLDEALRLEDRDDVRNFSVERSGVTGAPHGREVDKIYKAKLKKWFSLVDARIHEQIRSEHAPLVVACVDYEVQIYKDANTYPFLEDEAIEGNPDLLKAADIHRRAWRIVEPRFRQDLDKALERYRALAGTQKTSTDIGAILRATHDGRVQALFLARERALWGRFEPSTREMSLHQQREPGDDDLLDLAGVQVLNTGGQVFELPADRMPASTPVGAVFRY